MNNVTRAFAAREAIAAHMKAKGEEPPTTVDLIGEEQIINLITDLRHLCNVQAVSGQPILPGSADGTDAFDFAWSDVEVAARHNFEREARR